MLIRRDDGEQVPGFEQRWRTAIEHMVRAVDRRRRRVVVTDIEVSGRRVVDGDGHVFEDLAGIGAKLPDEYRTEYEGGSFPMLFPPIDHFHGMPLRVRGRERFGTRVGPEEWFEFLDAVGVECTVLYPSYALACGKIRDRDWAVTVTRAYNEWLAETYVARSCRFAGMAIVPLQDPAAAVAELRYAVEQLGLKGAVLPARGLPVHLGSKQFWPLLEEAERLECALGVHGGCHDGLGFDEMNVYAPVHALGHPFGQLIALGGLLFNGVWDRWPGLRIGFLEGGVAWLLLALERFQESYASHLPFDPSGDLVAPHDGDLRGYLLELLRTGRVVVGCEGAEPEIEYIVSTVGTSPFVYSTDFPHEVTVASCREELDTFAQFNLTDDQRDATLADNAARFYRLT